MAEYKKDIELRSEKVRNIVGQMPPALLRRGITIISLALVLLFVSAYFIPYPETVRIDLKLQSIPDSDTIKGVGYCSPLVKSKLKEGQVVHLESKGYQRLDAGLRKSFFENTLRMNLMVYDIFDWVKEKNHMQIENLSWNADKKYETRYATLSITYLFNNYKKKYRGGSAAGDDLNRF